jgi:hypothetical protein
MLATPPLDGFWYWLREGVFTQHQQLGVGVTANEFIKPHPDLVIGWEF